MYRCEVCGRVVGPGSPAIRQVVETRERDDPQRQDAPDAGRTGRKRSGRRGDPGGTGREIVREQLVCADCSEAEDALD